MSADFAAVMEEVLDLYAEPYAKKQSVVCFNKSPDQLIAEVRQPLSPEPGQPACYDEEYRHHGVCNLLMIGEPQRGTGRVLMTRTRNDIDFALAMKQVVARHAGSGVMRLALDNLNTHKIALLYKAALADEGCAFAKKADLHCTLKHGSFISPRSNLPC
jgi:hypothetical protein